MTNSLKAFQPSSPSPENLTFRYRHTVVQWPLWQHGHRGVPCAPRKVSYTFCNGELGRLGTHRTVKGMGKIFTTSFIYVAGIVLQQGLYYSGIQ